MNRARLIIGAALAVAIGACAHRSHHEEKAWSWRGELEPGALLTVHNTNGRVRVEPAQGNAVEVVAATRWRGRRAEPVRFVANRSGADATVCALWGKRGGECDAEDYRSSGRRSWWLRMFMPRASVAVDFTVRVPRGVRVSANSINGPITIEGVSSDIAAETVNGSIKAHTAGGAVDLQTVNGSITVAVDSIAGSGDISLETVNGSITAELPERLDARLEMSTVNGRVSSDFPLLVQGKLNPKEMRATIGSGGRLLKMETVNGSATLKKRSAAASS
jgi:hypothetical protein